MNKIIKYLILLILILITIQIVGYSIFSRQILNYRTISDIHFLYNIDQTDSLVLELKDGNAEKQKLVLEQRFLDSILFLNVVETEKWKSYRTDSNYYSVAIELNLKANFTSNAKYFSGTLYYGEEWEAKYIWLLFRWVQISMTTVGQS